MVKISQGVMSRKNVAGLVVFIGTLVVNMPESGKELVKTGIHAPARFVAVKMRYEPEAGPFETEKLKFVRLKLTCVMTGTGYVNETVLPTTSSTICAPAGNAPAIK